MPIVVFDGNNLLHRSMHASKDVGMTNSKGDETGGVFTALKSVRMLLNLDFLKPIESIYVVFDGGSSERRKRIYPEYKLARKRLKKGQTREEKEKYYSSFNCQRTVLCEAFSRLGCRVIRLSNREGDDVIYKLLGRLNEIGDSTNVVRFVISEDDDFYQLVDHHTWIYRPIAEKLIHYKNFEEHAKVPKDKFLLTKAVIGDKDEAPGVPGVAIKSVLEIIDEFYDEPTLLVASENHKSKRVQKIAKHMDLVSLGLELVDLSKEEFTNDEISYIDAKIKSPGVFDESGLMYMFRNLEFKSVIKDFEVWVSPFRVL